MLRQIRSEVGILWCNLAHDSLMWPVHGQYECRSCGRRYPAFGEPLATRRMNRRGLRQAMPLVMAVLLDGCFGFDSFNPNPPFRK